MSQKGWHSKERNLERQKMAELMIINKLQKIKRMAFLKGCLQTKTNPLPTLPFQLVF